MRRFSVLFLALILMLTLVCQQKRVISDKEVEMNENKEIEAIKKVIETSYIQGIHGDQDKETIKFGFHKDFNMLVLKDDTIDKVTVDEWLERIETMKAENPELWSEKTTYKFDLIDVAGYAAVAKLDVYKGTTHFSADFMLLYKFEDGWKIVSKIFAIPS
jgi:hypothetical protein